MDKGRTRCFYYIYNKAHEEIGFAFNDTLENVLNKLGQPDKIEPLIGGEELLSYVYGDLSIGINEVTNLVTEIYFPTDKSIFSSSWYKNLGQPDSGSKLDIHQFNNPSDNQILKFDVYNDNVTIYLFPNYSEDEEIINEPLQPLDTEESK